MNVLRKIGEKYAKLTTPKTSTPPYSHIVQLGDPVLRAEAEDVPMDKVMTIDIQKVIGSLKELTLGNNLFGLSAPQIGIPLRIFVIHVPDPRLTMSEEEIMESGVRPVAMQLY